MLQEIDFDIYSKNLSQFAYNLNFRRYHPLDNFGIFSIIIQIFNPIFHPMIYQL